jgi:hypothetical protein
MDPSVNITEQWGLQVQGDLTSLGDLQLDFPFNLEDFGPDLDLENLGFPPPQAAISGTSTQPIIYPTPTP